MVEDVEVFGAKLELPTLREVEVLGELDIPSWKSLGAEEGSSRRCRTYQKIAGLLQLVAGGGHPVGDLGRLKTQAGLSQLTHFGLTAGAGVLSL